jgi:hypothetical protein
MKRPLRIAMLAHSTNPRGGVMHAMHVAEALTELGCEVVLHAPDAKGQGLFRTPKCEARAFPVGSASAETFAMIEQRVGDYVAHFSFPRNRGFDIYRAQGGISGNALAALKQRGLIGAFVRTVHHIDDFPDERIARLDSRAIREADTWLTVSALWRDRLAETFAIQAAVCGNGVDIGRFRPDSGASGEELRATENWAGAPLSMRRRRRRAQDHGSSSRCVRAAPRRSARRATRHCGWREPAGARRISNEIPFAPRRHGRGGGFGSPSWNHRRQRHAAPLPPRVDARVRLGQGRIRALRAGGHGERRSRRRLGDRTVHELPLAGRPIWCDPSSVTSIAEAMALALDEKFAARLRGCGCAIAARFDWRAVARAHEPVYQRMTELAHA